MESERRNFVSATVGGNRLVLINLDRIRMVDQIGPGHLRLIFSERDTIDITGKGAALMLARLTDRGMELDGTPLQIANTNIASATLS